ncbi:MAG: tetratricopeptide repeat protein, partial [Candidatus Heimdallarchaeota archaeon]|nr:tetratricopeptide repeat protein [Candidatus Heimdallarchaeota archaeon]
EEVVVEEETKEPRNLEEELVLKELGDTPFTVSLYNLTILFEELDKLDEDDERSHNFIHLKVNESMDKLIEHLYILIGITAEEEWQKFIAYKFNTGDQENLRNIISLMSNKIKENKCEFCILSYIIFIGSLSQKFGMIDETMTFYEFILNQDSSNMIVLHNLGMLYGKLGQSDEAIKQFEKIIDREPKNALAYARVGDLLFYEKKKFNEAIDYYLKVLELDPNRISSGINLAAIYSKQENYSEATSILHKCLKDNPDESDLWLNYAILMVKQKKFHEAIEAYTKAIDVSPEDWKFKERAIQEKDKVEAIITSTEYIEQEEEVKPAVKDRYEIGKLFIFAHDPLDDEVFEAIFD